MAKDWSIKIPFSRKTSIVLLCLAVWFLLHVIYISWDGLRSYKGNADVAIVLGNPVGADSSLSPWLQGRVDQACQLYKSDRIKKIFVSGGPGDYGVAEGDAMKSYLLRKNIPDSSIIADNKGKNTFYTAKDFIALNDSCHFRSAIVVSSFYHVSRAKYILKKLGFSEVYSVSSSRYFLQDAYGIFREFFAFYEYLLLY
jgi:vancomycin permeability regulator SanA